MYDQTFESPTGSSEVNFKDVNVGPKSLLLKLIYGTWLAGIKKEIN